MIERENIVEELWRRIASVEGVGYTARNPKAPPNVSDMPAIQMFELDDVVEESIKRGGSKWPINKRKLHVVIEMFIDATREESSSKELIDFVGKYKSKLYAGGNTLGGLCEMNELSSAKILRPPVGESVAGIGFAYSIRYLENTALSVS